MPTRVGEWHGHVDYTVTKIDDFQVILGMDFLVQAKAAPMPHLGVMTVADEAQPCMVPRVRTQPMAGHKGMAI